MFRVVEAGAPAASETSTPANGRQPAAPIRQPNVVTWSGEPYASEGFRLITPPAYATATAAGGEPGRRRIVRWCAAMRPGRVSRRPADAEPRGRR